MPRKNGNHKYPELKLCLSYLHRKSEDERRGFLAFDVFKFTQFNVSQEHFALYMPTSHFIKYLLMTNTSEEQFATLIVPILFALLISRYSSTNKILIKIRNSYGFLLMTKGITILQTDCSSFVCWDTYFVHSTNVIFTKIRKKYEIFGWNRTKRINLFVRIEQYRRTK